MREMFLAGVPGRYIFHYGEEAGCEGSSDLAKYSPETLEGIKYAIALDRAGTSDIITSQLGDTCCSDEFAQSLIDALGLPYTPEYGSYTDTASYVDIIPECTNLSVGYSGAHSNRESVDFAHVGVLLDALVKMDQSRLICSRDPFAPKPTVTRFASSNPHAKHSYPAVIDRVDGNTRDALWRTSYGWGTPEWCDICDCPVIDEDDPNYHDLDHCVCTPEDNRPYDDIAIDTRGLTEDEVKFMRYLRGLD